MNKGAEVQVERGLDGLDPGGGIVLVAGEGRAGVGHQNNRAFEQSRAAWMLHVHRLNGRWAWQNYSMTKD